MEKYSSIPETLNHIGEVRKAINHICIELLKRGIDHDKSKMKSPEVEVFDKFTPLLKNMKFGSPEYEDGKKKMSVALDHHYANNPHHPEYFDVNAFLKGLNDNPIEAMNLIDIIEMFCDWYAASKRNKGGNLDDSITKCGKDFKINKQLLQIFRNTKMPD